MTSAPRSFAAGSGPSPWRERYLRNASLTGLANNVASAVAVAVFLPLVVDRAGMENYGIWATLSIFVGVASMADLGLSKTIVFLLPKRTDDAGRREVLRATSFLFLLLVGALGVAGAAILALDLNLWGENRSLPPAIGRLVTGYGVLVGMMVLASAFLRAILESCYKLHLVNVGFLALTVLQYLALFIAAACWGDVGAMLAASLIVYALVLLLNLLWVLRTVPARWLLPGKKAVGSVLRSSWSFLGIGLATAALEPLALFVLVRLLQDQADFGEYDIALRIARISNGMLMVFATPLFGLFSGMSAEGFAEIARLVRRVALRTAALFAGGMMILWLAGRTILVGWLGDSGGNVHELSLILVAGLGLAGVFESFTRALWAIGWARTTLWLRLGQLALIALGIALWSAPQPTMRVAGVMAVSFAAYAVGSAVAFRVVQARGTGRGSEVSSGGKP